MSAAIVATGMVMGPGCAPMQQQVQPTPAGFAGPGLTGSALIARDGTALPMRSWVPAGEREAVILALHGMNDHAGAFEMMGPWFAERGIAVHAFDQRGFGGAPQRGLWGGEALMADDLRVATALLRARHPGRTLVVLGDSMGAAVAMTAFGSADPPDADRLVLVAAAVWGWSTMNPLYAATLRAGARTFPGRTFSRPRGLRIQASDNLDMLERLGRDPLMIFQTRVDAMYGLVDLMERAARSGPAIAVPTLYQVGLRDQIVPLSSARAAVARLPEGARSVAYPEGWHMLLRDLGRETVYRDIEAFVRAPDAPLPSGLPGLAKP
jgi:alpha-beta hydrolase superfamily lysophospholipase